MAISIFKYSENKAVSVRLSGVDKNNKRWFAREMQQHDIQNYECLLSDTNIMKFMYQERQLKSNEIELRINNECRIGQPKGALTILDEQSVGFKYLNLKKKVDQK